MRERTFLGELRFLLEDINESKQLILDEDDHQILQLYSEQELQVSLLIDNSTDDFIDRSVKAYIDSLTDLVISHQYHVYHNDSWTLSVQNITNRHLDIKIDWPIKLTTDFSSSRATLKFTIEQKGLICWLILKTWTKLVNDIPDPIIIQKNSGQLNRIHTQN